MRTSVQPSCARAGGQRATVGSGQAVPGQAAACDGGGLRWRSDCPAMLRLVACVAELAAFAALTALKQRDETDNERAAREATSLPLLGASHARRSLPGHSLAGTVWFSCDRAHAVSSCSAVFFEHHQPLSKDACGQVAARLWSAEKVSRDSNSPGDCLCLANGRARRPGAACKDRACGPRAQRASLT